jgi:hypothetical protein
MDSYYFTNEIGIIFGLVCSPIIFISREAKIKNGLKALFILALIFLIFLIIFIVSDFDPPILISFISTTICATFFLNLFILPCILYKKFGRVEAVTELKNVLWDLFFFSLFILLIFFLLSC